VKPIYTAVNAAPTAALDELTEKWSSRYGAVIRLWENAWNEFIPQRLRDNLRLPLPSSQDLITEARDRRLQVDHT
jgi:hypothetical protein